MTGRNRLWHLPDERSAVPAHRTGTQRRLASSSHVARALALQRSAGNAAVAALLVGQGRAAPTVLARDSTDAPAATSGVNGTPGAAAAASPITELAERAGSAVGLRKMLIANPGLAQQIAAYFATGAAAPALNDLMAQAFSPAAGTAGEATKEIDKNPTDPSVPLPAQRADGKDLDKGHMKWALSATSHSSADVDVDFKPDENKVEAKNVSFGQTVINRLGSKLIHPGGTLDDPEKNKAKFQPFEEAATKKRIDHLVDTENDPFYGAEWDQAAKKWKEENPANRPGSSKKGVSSTSATLTDAPTTPFGREGKGDYSKEFETVAMVLETREPLGALKWGFKIKDAENAPIELTGATKDDCVDTPSASWGAAMDKFYAGKFAEILDDFDIGKADLKPDHKTKLDNIVTKLKANVALKAQLGGAADLTGKAKVNQALSLKRAQAARDYLTGKGIDAARLEVQSYGADWARVEAKAGTSEGKNRRVQIWLH